MAVALTPNIVKALKAVYTQAELETIRARVAAELLAGVTVTSLGMDNASGSGSITATPAELLEMVQHVLDLYAEDLATADQAAALIDFSGRCFQT